MWLRSLALLIALSSTSFAQIKTVESFSYETYLNDSIPDPNDKLSLVSLIENAAVQRELGMSSDQVSAYKEQLEACDGSFSSVTRRLGEKSPLDSTREEMLYRFESERAKRRIVLDEIISPRQWDRLHELAYQIEVARVGWLEAITAGRLGRDIGVYENQWDGLKRTAKQIETEKLSEVVAILTLAQSKFLALINANDRSSIQQAIEAPFGFVEYAPNQQNKELPEYHFSTVHASQRNWEFIFNPSVQAELGIERDARELEKLRNFIEAGAGVVEVCNELHDMFTNGQRARWQELIYQIEIHRFGFYQVLKQRSLSGLVNVPPEELEKVAQQSAGIEQEKSEAIARVLAKAQAAYLKALVPEQATKARLLIGQPFDYRDEIYLNGLERGSRLQACANWCDFGHFSRCK